MPERRKLYGPILDRLYSKCVTEQKQFLDNHTGYGRAVTGDGATIMGTKFINFLVHEHGKGVMLCKIRDCTDRLKEVGSIQSTFIAHEMIAAIRCYYFFFVCVNICVTLCYYYYVCACRSIGASTVYLVVIDGGADWVASQAMVRAKFPWIHFLHCVAHQGSLIIKDVCKIDEVSTCITSYIIIILTYIRNPIQCM